MRNHHPHTSRCRDFKTSANKMFPFRSMSNFWMWEGLWMHRRENSQLREREPISSPLLDGPIFHHLLPRSTSTCDCFWTGTASAEVTLMKWPTICKLEINTKRSLFNQVSICKREIKSGYRCSARHLVRFWLQLRHYLHWVVVARGNFPICQSVTEKKHNQCKLQYNLRKKQKTIGIMWCIKYRWKRV